MTSTTSIRAPYDSTPKVKPDERFIRSRLALQGIYSIRALATHLGVNEALTHRLIKGERVSRPTADRIAALLDLPTPEVFPVYATETEAACRAA